MTQSALPRLSYQEIAETSGASSTAASPAGHYLYFLSDRKGAQENYAANFHVVAAKPSSQVLHLSESFGKVNANGFAGSGVRFLRDDTLLVFVTEIKAVFYDLPNQKVLTSYDSGLNAKTCLYVSPDERWILVGVGACTQGASRDVRLYDLEQNKEIKLAGAIVRPGGGLLSVEPLYSPDGQYLYYQQQTDTMSRWIRRRLLTGDETVLLDSCVPYVNALSPDNRFAAVTVDCPRGVFPNLFVLDLETKTRTQLTTYDAGIVDIECSVRFAVTGGGLVAACTSLPDYREVVHATRAVNWEITMRERVPVAGNVTHNGRYIYLDARVYDAMNRSWRKYETPSEGGQFPMGDLFSPSAKWFAVGREPLVAIFDPAGGQMLATIKLDAYREGFSFLGDALLLSKPCGVYDLSLNRPVLPEKKRCQGYWVAADGSKVLYLRDDDAALLQVDTRQDQGRIDVRPKDAGFLAMGNAWFLGPNGRGGDSLFLMKNE